jgi:hypothetical protein
MFPWLATLGAWALRLLGGFVPSSGQKIGKLLWVGGIAFLVLLAFNFFQKPNTEANTFNGNTTVNKGEDPKVKYSTFGCSLGHIRGVVQWNW